MSCTYAPVFVSLAAIGDSVVIPLVVNSSSHRTTSYGQSNQQRKQKQQSFHVMFVLNGDLAPRSGEVSLLPPLGAQEHAHTMCRQRAARRL
jgi:hypothetical protein